jgi:hypothetical protein
MAYEPAAAKDSPRAYYLFLRSQGIPPLQAVQRVEERFGPPKTDKEKAKDEQMNSLMQMGGNIGGLLLTSEIMRGFPNLGGLFGSGSAGAGTAGAGAGTAGAGAGAAKVGTGVATPKLLGAKTVGGTGTGSSSSLGAAGSYALPAIAAAITLNNMYETGGKDILRGKGDRADWTNQAVNNAPLLSMILGSGGFLPVATALPLANIGLRLLGKKSIGHYMTTGKSDAQLNRDDFRGFLKEKGVVDDNYEITLANGSKFNIGLDGKTKYTNTDGKTTRNAWDVDFSNPLAKMAVNKIDPIIRSMYANPPKGVNPEQYTGMLVNAVTSGAKNEQDVMANINAITNKGQLGRTQPPPTTPPTTQAAPPAITPPAPQQNQVKGPAPLNQPPPPIAPTGNMSIRDLLNLYMRK